jgi:hypothetical protein
MSVCVWRGLLVILALIGASIFTLVSWTWFSAYFHFAGGWRVKDYTMLWGSLMVAAACCWCVWLLR